MHRVTHSSLKWKNLLDSTNDIDLSDRWIEQFIIQ